jgi:replication factor A1
MIFCFYSNSSNTSVNVAWGERATSFPGDQVCKDGQTSPQVIIFVGTIVKNGKSLLDPPTIGGVYFTP